MEGKAKTCFICGILFILAGVVAIFAGAPSYIRYGSITLGIAFEAMASHESKKNGGR